jgi:hypothetical protein
MPVLVFYLVGLYLAASVFSLVLAVSIRLRASRSAASHVGSLYFSFVLIQPVVASGWNGTPHLLTYRSGWCGPTGWLRPASP